jgi:hypothetical protein
LPQKDCPRRAKENLCPAPRLCYLAKADFQGRFEIQAHIQCLRCSKAIPIGPEMVSQVVPCPSCMDRVYISANLLAVERSRSETAAPASAHSQGFAADVLANVLSRMRPEGSEGGNSVAIIFASVGVVAVLVLAALGLVVLRNKPKDDKTEVTETAANTLPAKLEARPPTFPPAPLQGTAPPPVAAPVAAPPPSTAARAWSLRASSSGSIGAAASALSGQQPTSAARWPEYWRLPDLASSVTARLASLSDADLGLRVSLNSAAADFALGSSVALIPEIEQSTKLPIGVGETIAGIRIEGPDLVLSWAVPQNEARLASQLVNCLLEINDGKQKRVAQLREPVRAEPIAIDLTSDMQQVETLIDNPPRNTALQLEVADLNGFPSEAKLRGGARTTGVALTASTPMMPTMGPPSALPPGVAPGFGMPTFPGLPVSGSVTIEFPDIPGLEIHIGLKQESERIVISVDPMFREDGKEGELSLRRIAQMEEDAKRPLPNAQRDLESAERSLRLWSDKLKESNANEPPPTSRRFPAWKLKHMEATRNAASFEKGVTDLNARVEKSKSRLDLATKLRAFLKDSNKQATIHYVVYSECGETDLLLIDGRGR